jgi:DNA-binding CsgD family transcriptional regulator
MNKTIAPADASSHFPDQFQRQSLTLVGELVSLSSSVFFLIAPDMRHHGVALYNLDEDVEKQYQKKFLQLDPLNPQKFNHSEQRVVSLDAEMPFDLLRKTIYYQDFMQPNDHRHVADMFFRNDGEIIAVMSLLRQQALGPFLESELELLNKLQPFLEYTLNAVYLPKRLGQRRSLQSKYELTPRELDVLEQLLVGASSKLIASNLAMALPTVKTHLRHIFQKIGVSSRAELLSQIIEELQANR